MSSPNQTVPPADHVPPPPRRRGRWPFVGLALLILASGMVIGAVVSALVTRQAVLGAMRDPGRVSTRLVSRLTEDLGLTEEQAEAVRRIVEKRAANLRELRAEVAPRLREEVRLMEEEIAVVLDPEQAKLWKGRIDRMHNYLPSTRRGGPHQGDGRGADPRGSRRRWNPDTDTDTDTDAPTEDSP